jgi:hypothetical protein
MTAMKAAAELCEALLSCAGRHGEAEGSEAQLGDIEDFFRAAYDRLTPEQLGRFWDDPRVAGTVREIPEYEELAAEVHPRGEPSDVTGRAAQGAGFDHERAGELALAVDYVDVADFDPTV